ncbi:nucleoside deaminase [Herbiconiux sp. CPCC 205763]|uniref:Nucleoside deaminase n=1 Tax=Herbiconiux aconitum TaxID=2970913 RepID=A0ABT2GNN0_9MICO|nr:nucleoside deaminase [Herbiconiux aconitum]MCS5717835.1 nucleoside deaminase [Herbiconiux aconitum]
MAASDSAASDPHRPTSSTGLDPDELDAGDREHLERAVALAQAARDRGDHPFGALLATTDGTVIEAMNTVNTGHDPIGHAETNLVRDSGQRLEMAELATSTLYTSTEPCAMCTGAIYWAGIPRVVFALSEQALGALVSEQSGVPTLALPSREVLARGGRPVEVVGPVALPAATDVHRDFWD